MRIRNHNLRLRAQKALCECLATLLVFSSPASFHGFSSVISFFTLVAGMASHSAWGTSGNCNSADGSNSQGGSNGGDQGGGGAGEFLFGIAAIIAAVAPMVVAGIESEKEQNIAKIEAETQITQAEIQTGTQKELANLSSQTALKQAEASREVAKMNNEAQTQRLQINIAAAQQQRNEDRQAQLEQLEFQRQAEAQKIALAERQADEAIQLARQNREAQSLQVALGGGSGLGSAQSASNSSTGANTLSPLASSLSSGAAQATASSPAPALKNTGTEIASTGNRNGGSSKINPSSTRQGMLPMARGFLQLQAPVSSANDKLMASLDSSLESVPALKKVFKRTSPKKNFGISKNANAGVRGFNEKLKPLRNSRALYANGADPKVGGSYPESEKLNKKRTALAEFAESVDSEPVFTQERGRGERTQPRRYGSTH